MTKLEFSSNQIFTLVVASFVNFFCSTCVSLQAPFYPAEAEKKGATATEYGLVIGSYELVCFLTSPFFGKIIRKTGSKSMLGIGMVVSSITVALFGLLHIIESRFYFIFWSFVIRIVEALGASAATVASFSVISCMFPDSVATVMSTLETFYGLGFIVGPTVGGLLFEVGGFPLPFFFVGVVSGILSFLILVYVPNVSGSSENGSSDGNIISALKIPSISIDAACTATFALSQGFFSSTLEPHLRMFHISPVLVSMMFVINGATYAVASPFVGRLVDKCLKPKYALIISLILNFISFAILGPLPFLPIPQTLTVCMIALFLQGLALAGGNVAGFIDSIRSAVGAGYPADISTYGLMSGIWASAFAFGAFIGPSVAGFLYDIVGFQYATIFVVVVNVILLVILLAYLLVKNCDEEEVVENEEIVRKLGESTNSLLKLNLTKDMSIRSSQIISRGQKSNRRTGYVSI